MAMTVSSRHNSSSFNSNPSSWKKSNWHSRKSKFKVRSQNPYLSHETFSVMHLQSSSAYACPYLIWVLKYSVLRKFAVAKLMWWPCTPILFSKTGTWIEWTVITQWHSMLFWNIMISLRNNAICFYVLSVNHNNNSLSMKILKL